MQKEFIQSIEKPKIPKNYVYILKSNQLNELLMKNQIFINTDLIYWIPQEIGSIFEAQYWLPNANISYPRLYIRAGALLKDDEQTAKELMKNRVLPDFANWLNDILKLPNNSTVFNKTPYFNAIVKINQLIIKRA